MPNSMDDTPCKGKSSVQNLLTKYGYELQEERHIDTVLQEGIALATNGKWEHAAEIFQNVIVQSPDYDVPQLWFGDYLERTKSALTAIDALCASAAKCRRKHHLLRKAGEFALFKLHDIHRAAQLFAQSICVMTDRPHKYDYAAQRPFLFMKALFEAYWNDEGVAWAEKAIRGESALSGEMVSEINEIIQSRKRNTTKILEEIKEISRCLLRMDIKKENVFNGYCVIKYEENMSLETEVKVITEIIDSIKYEEVIVFCGAGISKNSGLPVVGQLVPYILDKLEVQKAHKDLLLDDKRNLKGMPFELFMEILSESSDIEKINDIYDADKPDQDSAQPNANHLLISALIKQNKLKTVVTTNFDQLIEKALAMGHDCWIRGREYDVLYKSDDIGAIDWSGDRVRIVKIHGSVDDKKNMAITMRQVAGKQLSMQRKAVIDHVFSSGTHKTVFILGYSCSDLFDISPYIEEIWGERKKVLLLEHAQGPKLEDIREKKHKNPFGKFTAGKRFYYNTDVLGKKLWGSFCAHEPYIDQVSKTPHWRNNVDDWYNEIVAKSKANMYLIPGLIFYNSSEFDVASSYYERAITAARANNERREEGIGLCNLGNPCYKLGEYQKAIGYVHEALLIAREIGDKKLEGITLGNLGTIHGGMEVNQISIEYCEQALLIFRHIKDIKREASCLENLGEGCGSLGEYQKAIVYHEEALKLAQTVGDKHNEASCLSSLGTSYSNLGQYQKAIEYHEQSLRIYLDIVDKCGEIILLCDLGHDNRSLGEYRKAVDYHEQALKIALDNEDKYGEACSLNGLGKDNESLGEYRKAIDYYERAQQIACDIEDKITQGDILCNLGNTYFLLKEYRKAIECYQRSMAISLPLLSKNHPNMKTIEKNIQLVNEILRH